MMKKNKEQARMAMKESGHKVRAIRTLEEAAKWRTRDTRIGGLLLPLP